MINDRSISKSNNGKKENNYICKVVTKVKIFNNGREVFINIILQDFCFTDYDP